MAKKPSLGRQKIKIAKIQIKNHLQVTFSKRRSGLFKKASELCTLCGVEIAIVVFSPAGKVFSFGHPKVESITDRFLARNPNNILNTRSNLHLVESHRIASIPELNLQLMYMLNELEAEKKRTEVLDEMRKDSRSQFWWEARIEDLNLHELEQLKGSMEELKKTVVMQANKIFAESSDSVSLFGANNSIRGGFDHYEMKLAGIISSSSGASHIHSYGYVHGLLLSHLHFLISNNTKPTTLNQTCPLDVAQENNEQRNGIPMNFLLAIPNRAGVIRSSADLNIRFSGATTCGKPAVWRVKNVNGQRVVSSRGVVGNPGGETISNWFKIEKYENDYKIVFCPGVCNSCRPACGDVGTTIAKNGRRSLLLSSGPLKVKFKKAVIIN
ncbi:hypothetical protein L1987_75453 [Smallanthus sonchifolius]|uniref:Uncharacterized protein n=1 Tax=Smallanthus sonchifolius TaxID=185202 RepID=A0ACB9A6G4_9ASTR|nr:hypothetical protein L1987_75453 [Smallanthus sonchifolius]